MKRFVNSKLNFVSRLLTSVFLVFSVFFCTNKTSAYYDVVVFKNYESRLKSIAESYEFKDEYTRELISAMTETLRKVGNKEIQLNEEELITDLEKNVKINTSNLSLENNLLYALFVCPITNPETVSGKDLNIPIYKFVNKLVSKFGKDSCKSVLGKFLKVDNCLKKIEDFYQGEHDKADKILFGTISKSTPRGRKNVYIPIINFGVGKCKHIKCDGSCKCINTSVYLSMSNDDISVNTD